MQSDLLDLFGAHPSRDLASGTITLPLALYLERVAPADQTAMWGLLDATGNAPDRRHDVSHLLRRSGVLRDKIGIVQSHCLLALQQIESLEARGRGPALLRDIVAAASLFPL